MDRRAPRGAGEWKWDQPAPRARLRASETIGRPGRALAVEASRSMCCALCSKLLANPSHGTGATGKATVHRSAQRRLRLVADSCSDFAERIGGMDNAIAGKAEP